jgi:hypothetical protein
MAKSTESEYAGTVPTENSVQALGPEDRKLKTHERLRLGYLTGQEEDPTAKAKPGFFYGVDEDYPELDGAGRPLHR